MPVEASQELLIKITANADLMKSQTEEAKQALVSLKKEAEVSNKSLVQTSRGTDVLDRSLRRLGSTARLDVFRMMANDVAFTTIGMTNLGRASGLVRTGLFGLQTGLATLLGPAGLVGLAIAGMTVVTMFKKKADATKKAREELDKNITSIYGNIDALIELDKAGKFTYSEDRALILKKIKDAQEEIKKTEMKVRAAVQQSGKTWEEARLAALEATAKQRLALEKLKEKLQDIDSELLLQKGIVEDLGRVTLDTLWQNITKSKEYREELEKLNKVGKKEVPQFIKAPEGFKEAQAIGEQWKKNEDAIREYYGWVKRTEDQAKRMIDSEMMLQDYTLAYIGTMSDAFADMMMGVEVQWDRMIQSMIASMISSGLQNLIGSLIFGPAFTPFGIFAGAFQTGTPFVPKTGLYMLHQGEAVVPAEKNIYNSQTWNQQQSTVQNIYIISIDPKKLTRKEIAPAIKEMIKNRELSL